MVLFLGLELAVTEFVTLLWELLVLPVILAVVNFFVRLVVAVKLVKSPRRTVLCVLAVPLVVVLVMPLCTVLCSLLAELGGAVELLKPSP